MAEQFGFSSILLVERILLLCSLDPLPKFVCSYSHPQVPQDCSSWAQRTVQALLSPDYKNSIVAERVCYAVLRMMLKLLDVL